ncbi:MAG: hypothetical protein ACRD5J_14490, partial [Nitrososphaeraceae archaeon]
SCLVVYEIDLETEKVKKCKMQPSIVLNKKMINTGINSNRMQVRWAKRTSVEVNALDLNGNEFKSLVMHSLLQTISKAHSN